MVARLSVKAEPVYEMKHRLVGAALMVGVAVLIIPFLLKDPGIEANVDVVTTSSNQSEEQTFKSKIEPLNLNNINIEDSGIIPGKEEASDLKPALLDSGEVASNSESIDSEPEQFSEEPETSIVLSPDTDTQVAAAAPETIENSEPETVAEAESGWSVRVGTFSKQENVETISTLLNDSGFNARHTKVQTTLGEATRVWLGPYAEKKTAEKVSKRLKNLTGEKGYVTKHTS